jgi:hypothetical protein
LFHSRRHIPQDRSGAALGAASRNPTVALSPPPSNAAKYCLAIDMLARTGAARKTFETMPNGMTGGSASPFAIAALIL